jgi:hypothetical protein
MTKIPLSQLLTNEQLNVLNGLAILDGTWCASPTNVGSFIERYIVAEALARNLIALNSGKQCPNILYLQSIKSAARSFEASLNIPSDLIDAIFRSSNARAGNVSTPRQLRNLLIHGLSSKARLEVEREHKKLMDLMKRWLDIF